jgi:hypothetical protein
LTAAKRAETLGGVKQAGALGRELSPSRPPVLDTILGLKFLLPGDGQIDYVEYFKLLNEFGYSGFVSVKVSAQIHRKPEFEPIPTARLCYERLAPARLLRLVCRGGGVFHAADHGESAIFAIQKKTVMVAAYLFVALPILLLFMVERPGMPALFAVVFGFGLGDGHMLIPLMAAQAFGTNLRARAMGVILPADSIGQTCFPFLLGVLHDRYGNYPAGLALVATLALAGAAAIALLPAPESKGRQL